MRCCLILDPLQKSVRLGSEEVPIYTSHRNSILFELLMQRGKMSEAEKVIEAIRLYYPPCVHKKVIENKNEAIERMLDFYTGGVRAAKGSSEKAVFDFEYDSDYIYAAFLSQYGLDLTECDLHWHKFKALFLGLEPTNKICEIMKIRSIEITNDMSDNERAYYRKLKGLYRLPDMRSRAQKELDFANSFFI